MSDLDDLSCNSGLQAEPRGGFVLIRPGTFLMGSPDDEEGRNDDEVQHEVTITHHFLLNATPVTQAEWESVMGYNPSHFEGGDRPVERVSWYEAVVYCNALSERDGLEPAYSLTNERGKLREGIYKVEVKWKGLDCPGFRLPTEAEWEYAARAGTTGARYGELDEIAWWNGNSGGETHPVGHHAPNAWGLNDMLGNVWEWTNDWSELNLGSDAVTDPVGPAAATGRVRRGGSWGSNARRVRAALRLRLTPDNRCYYIGFRPVRTFLL